MTLPWLCAWITVETLANVKKGDNVIIIGALSYPLPHVLERYLRPRRLQVLAEVSVLLQHSFAKTVVPAYSVPIPRSPMCHHHRT